MSDFPLKELKIVVERVVRPLRASAAAKRRMREELLAHLVTIYDDEFEKSNDEQIALERTQSRFGDPRSLSQELRQAVSFWSQVRSYLDDLLFVGSCESALRIAGRTALFTFAGYFCLVFPAMLAVSVARPKSLTPLLAPLLAMVAASLVSAFAFAFMLFAVSIARALHPSDTKRSPFRATALCIASLAMFPVLAFVPVWLLSTDLTESLIQLRRACYFAPVAPIVFVLMSRQLAEEMRYNGEWARLEI